MPPISRLTARRRACLKRCLVPASDCTFLSVEWKDALWDRFYTAAPRRQRRSVEQYKIVKRAWGPWPGDTASIRRRSPSGGSEARPMTSEPARQTPAPRCSPPQTKPSSSPSGSPTLLPLDNCLYALRATIPHPFDRACQRYGIEHRLTKPNHPRTNEQVERMNRTIKGATVKRFNYDSHGGNEKNDLSHAGRV